MTYYVVGKYPYEISHVFYICLGRTLYKYRQKRRLIAVSLLTNQCDSGWNRLLALTLPQAPSPSTTSFLAT